MKTIFNRILFILLLLLLILGGIFGQTFWFISISTIGLGILALLIFLGNHNFIISKNFKYYLIFLISFLISLVWSSNFNVSFRLFMLFLSAGFIYLIFYNIPQKVASVNLPGLIIMSGILFGLTIVAKLFTHTLDVDTIGGLIGYTSFSKNHLHLADLWSVIIAISIYKIITNWNRHIYLWVVGITVGIVFIILGGSRSAILSLLVGVIYLFSSSELTKKKQLFKYFLIVLIIVALIALSAGKSLLFSRTYFIQPFEVITKYPFGIGVGNFGYISLRLFDSTLVNSSFSSLTHNIILEFVSGMGVSCVTFIYWLYKEVRQISSKYAEITISRLVFVVLLINFLFDTTYFIPTMLWLWFAAIGTINSKIDAGL